MLLMTALLNTRSKSSRQPLRLSRHAVRLLCQPTTRTLEAAVHGSRRPTAARSIHSHSFLQSDETRQALSAAQSWTNAQGKLWQSEYGVGSGDARSANHDQLTTPLSAATTTTLFFSQSIECNGDSDGRPASLSVVRRRHCACIGCGQLLLFRRAGVELHGSSLSVRVGRVRRVVLHRRARD